MFSTVVNTIKHQWKCNGKVKFVFVALGIFVSFVYVGVLQEKIMKGCYGDPSDKCKNGEKFKFAVTLVFVKSMCGLVFIKVLDLIHPEKKKDTTHFLYYASSAAANSLSMVGANMSLRWVSYPAQVIFKSAKPLSVMILGLIFCKRYTIQRYFFVLVIVTGVVVFKLFEAKEDKIVKNKIEEHEISDMQQILGMSLLIFSLTMDGVLGAIQDRMRSIHAPTFRQLMFNTYLWGCGYLIITIFVTREFLSVLPFISRHPEVLWHFFTFGMADAIGNVFIFSMISCFGALACSVTGTVRKFFSVIFSIIFFGHPSTPLQWFGACLVFAALLADAFFGKNKKHSTKETENEDIERGDTGSNESKIENENTRKGENGTIKGAEIFTTKTNDSLQKSNETKSTS